MIDRKVQEMPSLVPLMHTSHSPRIVQGRCTLNVNWPMSKAGEPEAPVWISNCVVYSTASSAKVE
jgi:hypothetical protein